MRWNSCSGEASRSRLTAAHGLASSEADLERALAAQVLWPHGWQVGLLGDREGRAPHCPPRAS